MCLKGFEDYLGSDVNSIKRSQSYVRLAQGTSREFPGHHYLRLASIIPDRCAVQICLGDGIRRVERYALVIGVLE